MGRAQAYATALDLAAPARDVVTFDTDGPLLTRVLRPYRSHCQYLKSAVVTASGDASDGRRVSATCELEIPTSCYIDDTGHFNSVEFNICYNQMLYYLVAKSVREALVDPFTTWTIDDFWSRQLPDFLITDFRSTFKRAMRGSRFHGEITLTDVADWEGNDLRQALITLWTTCRYWDDRGGYSQGEVRIAITNPPRPGEQTSERFNDVDASRPSVAPLPATSRSERRRALEEIVTSELKAALLMGEDDDLPRNESLFDLGLTSLRITEIKQRLEERLGCSIDTTLMFNNPTVSQVTTHLQALTFPELVPAAEDPDSPKPGDEAADECRSLVDEMLTRLYTA